MRTMQTKFLPYNWLEQVNNFDIKKSNFSKNNEIIANTLINYIRKEKNDSLLNPLATLLISNIVLKREFLTEYDNLPLSLIEDGMLETEGARGVNFSRKLHSVFIEFLTYMKLEDRGYKLRNIRRTSGACDLPMEKNSKNYNFEVKFKESTDIFQSRLLDGIDGMSLLDEYIFLRGKTFELHVKSEDVNYDIQNEILNEIKCFLQQKEDLYEGQHIDIFEISKRNELTRDIEKVNKYIQSLEISQDLTEVDGISELIKKIFIDKNGHITKLSKKSKSINDFYGCLVWSFPFHNDINCENVKIAFGKLNLDFDLYIFISGIAKTECNFYQQYKKPLK